MTHKLYQALTHMENYSDKPRLIQWYYPERLKPLANCQQLISDYYLCPDEPSVLSELEFKIYHGLLTQEEQKNFLTLLEPDDPEYLEGVNLSKEELELWKNHRYTKNELTRAINEFFTVREVKVLKQYLEHNFELPLCTKEIVFPMSNFCFKGYCRESWNSNIEPDYILHEDPGFPLDIPVEGIIMDINIVNVNITMQDNGKLKFRYSDD